MARKLAEKYKKEILTIGLILVVVLAFMGIQSVYASLMTEEKDVISTSAPDTVANHEIWFKPGTNFAASNTLKITLDGLFTTPPSDHEDVDLSFGTAGTNTEIVLAATAASTNTWECTISNTEVTFTVPSTASAEWLPTTSDLVKVEIGTNATADDGTGDEQYKNPIKVDVLGTADIYDIDIVNQTTSDTGKAMVAIIEGVTVTATVAESLKFYIADGSADCDTAFGNELDATVDSSSVNFGTLTVDTFTHGCQYLSIGTNAANGYGVTSQESDYLKSDSITLPDTTCNASGCDETNAEPWTAAGTYYGFGHTCSSIDASGCHSEYSTGNSYRQFARTTTETPQDIMVNGSTPTVVTEKSLVEYKVSVSNIQPAGIYTNTVTYIATPNF